MKDLETLYRELQHLTAEFDELMAEQSREHDRKADFAAIEELAGKKPIENRALAHLDKTNQTRYLRLVCTAASLDGEISTDQLLYLQRLAVGAEAAVKPPDLLCMAYQTDYLEWQAAAVNLKKVALPMLLDVMIVIHLAKRTPERGLDFTASLAALLEYGVDDLEVTAKLTASLLTRDFQAFKTIRANRAYPEFSYAVPDQWLESTSQSHQTYEMRKIEAAVYNRLPSWTTFAPQLATNAHKEFQNGDRVKAGDILVSFSTTIISHPKDTDKYFKLPTYPPIRAPYSGIVWYCYVSDNKCKVWVTSAFEDNSSFMSTPVLPEKKAVRETPPVSPSASKDTPTMPCEKTWDQFGSVDDPDEELDVFTYLDTQR